MALKLGFIFKTPFPITGDDNFYFFPCQDANISCPLIQSDKIN